MLSRCRQTLFSFEIAKKLRQWRNNSFVICVDDKSIFSIFFEDLDIVSEFVKKTHEKKKREEKCEKRKKKGTYRYLIENVSALVNIHGFLYIRTL